MSIIGEVENFFVTPHSPANIAGVPGSEGFGANTKQHHTSLHNQRWDFADHKARLSQREIAELWILNGGDAGKADLMSAIAMAESSGIVHSQNTCCKGLWAFNTEVGVSTNKCAFKPSCAAKQAVKTSQNGTELKPWETYTNGAYKKFLGKSGISSNTEFSPLGQENESALGISDPIKEIVQFIARLFEPSFWLRVGKGILGFVLLLMGAITLLKVLTGIEIPLSPVSGALKGSVAAAAGKG